MVNVWRVCVYRFLYFLEPIQCILSSNVYILSSPKSLIFLKCENILVVVRLFQRVSYPNQPLHFSILTENKINQITAQENQEKQPLSITYF